MTSCIGEVEIGSFIFLVMNLEVESIDLSKSWIKNIFI